MILSAQTIRRRQGEHELISPFSERSEAFGLTYGLGPAGYDVRLAQDLRLEGVGHASRPKGCFVLGSSLERLTVPDDLLVMVCDKSTWVRRGVAVQNSTADPGFRGYLTLEITNHSSDGVELLRGMPIAHLVFVRLDEPTESPYDGKYQDQGPAPVRAR